MTSSFVSAREHRACRGREVDVVAGVGARVGERARRLEADREVSCLPGRADVDRPCVLVLQTSAKTIPLPTHTRTPATEDEAAGRAVTTSPATRVAVTRATTEIARTTLEQLRQDNEDSRIRAVR